MLALFFKMINEYKSIVSQMFDDLSTNSIVATNYELVWCGNHNAMTNLYVANVGANTKFEQTCSK